MHDLRQRHCPINTPTRCKKQGSLIMLLRGASNWDGCAYEII
jgi:hypothetical protein